MKRAWMLVVGLMAGCSTHPIGDTLDFFKPGKLYPDGQTAPYGGVCCNQGPVVGPGAGGPPQINVGPPTPLMPAGPAAGPVIPPPVPLTGGAPAPPIPPPPPPPPPR